MDYITGWEMRKDTIQYTMDFNPPGVDLHCLYGTSVPTVEKYAFFCLITIKDIMLITIILF